MFLCTLKPHNCWCTGHLYDSSSSLFNATSPSNWNYVTVTEHAHIFFSSLGSCQFRPALPQCQQPDTLPLLSLPFTVTVCIVLHGNQMINQWTHLPSFSSIIEPCCHAAETKACKLVCFAPVMAGNQWPSQYNVNPGQSMTVLKYICFITLHVGKCQRGD